VVTERVAEGGGPVGFWSCGGPFSVAEGLWEKMADADEDEPTWVPLKVRRAQKLAQAQGVAAGRPEKRPRGLVSESAGANKNAKRSLLDERAEALAAGAQVTLSKEEEGAKEEANILSAIDNGMKPLMSVKELATGVVYSESMVSTWRPPPHIRALDEVEHQETRDKWHILVEGEDTPPPIKSFREVRVLTRRTRRTRAMLSARLCSALLGSARL
jgi:ATP-dependent RNA helicase DDX41